MNLKFKLFKKKQKKTKLSSPGILSKLPKELIVCIYQQLDSRQDTIEFSHTCRLFHAISQDIRSKAAWIVTRFGPRFAIYYALLCFPHHCNQQLIQVMIHLGAATPIHLIQSLVKLYGAPTPQKSNRRPSDLQDHFFSSQIQKVPFEGYLALIQHQPQLTLEPSHLTLFFSSLETQSDSWRQMILQHGFFPAPLEAKRQPVLLKMALQAPDLYRRIQPLFEFDPVARAALWESVLLVLWDEAFKSRTSDLSRLRLIESVVTDRVDLLGSVSDKLVFSKVLVQLCSRYPVGYCSQETMSRLLHLLIRYLKPNFKIDMALEYIVLSNFARQDTSEFIDHFLKHELSKI